MLKKKIYKYNAKIQIKCERVDKYGLLYKMT